MKLHHLALPLALALAAPGFAAAAAKTYQVTGPIVALTETVITVDKNGEKHEIARTSNTKIDGKLAVGSRVTVHYRMSAESIEVKDSAKSSTEKADQAAEKSAKRAK